MIPFEQKKQIRLLTVVSVLVCLGFILAEPCFGPMRSGCTVCVWSEICWDLDSRSGT